MCTNWASDKNTSKAYGSAIAIIIIVVNIVLKTVIIKLVVWIAEDTHSAKLTMITNGVFIAQFLNSGLLLVSVNANLEEHGPYFITKYFRGPYYDYSPEWYSDVGQKIFQTMIINAIMPYITLIMGWAIPALKRSIDSGFSGN